MKLLNYFAHCREIQASKPFRENAKRRLFKRIDAQIDVQATPLFSITKLIRVVDEVRIAMKHRLFEQISYNWYDAYLERLHVWTIQVIRPLLAGALASFVFLFSWHSPMTEAFDRPTLTIDAGNVSVIREGASLQFQREIIIEPGDEIISNNDGVSTITFPPSTEIRIAKEAHARVRSTDDGLIFIELFSGKAWTTAFPHIKHKGVYIETPSGKLALQYGSFSITAGEITTVQAFQNGLQVEPIGAKPIAISAGNEMKISKAVVEVEPITELPKDEWSKSNMKRDDTLRKTLLEKEVLESRGEVAGMSSFIESVSDTVVGIVTEKETSIDSIRSAFADVKQQALEGNNDEALQLFATADAEMKTYWNENLNSSEALDAINLFLAEQKTIYRKVLPGEALYILKPHVYDIIVRFSASPKNQRIALLKERKLEVEDIILGEMPTSALVVSLDSYINEMNKLTQENLNIEQRSSLQELMKHHKDALVVLTLAEKSIEDTFAKKHIATARKELVSSMNQISSVLSPVIVASSAPIVDHVPSEQTQQVQAKFFSENLQKYLEQINTYSSSRGRHNMVVQILHSIADSKDSLPLLFALKESAGDDVALPIAKKILHIQRQ